MAFADARENVSVVTACKADSIATLQGTLVSKEVVKFQTSLCLIVGKPPKGHTIVWFMVKENLHWQDLDVLRGILP